MAEKLFFMVAEKLERLSLQFTLLVLVNGTTSFHGPEAVLICKLTILFGASPLVTLFGPLPKKLL